MRLLCLCMGSAPPTTFCVFTFSLLLLPRVLFLPEEDPLFSFLRVEKVVAELQPALTCLYGWPTRFLPPSCLWAC